MAWLPALTPTAAVPTERTAPDIETELGLQDLRDALELNSALAQGFDEVGLARTPDDAGSPGAPALAVLGNQRIRV